MIRRLGLDKLVLDQRADAAQVAEQRQAEERQRPPGHQAEHADRRQRQHRGDKHRAAGVRRMRKPAAGKRAQRRERYSSVEHADFAARHLPVVRKRRIKHAHRARHRQQRASKRDAADNRACNKKTQAVRQRAQRVLALHLRRGQRRERKQRQQCKKCAERGQRIVPRHPAPGEQHPAEQRRNHRPEPHCEHRDGPRLHQVFTSDDGGRGRQQRRHADRPKKAVPHPEQIDGSDRGRGQHGVYPQPDKPDPAGGARQQNELFTLVAVGQHAAGHQSDKHRRPRERHCETNLKRRAGERLDLYRYRHAEQAETENGDKTRQKNGAISRMRFQ
ncbi:putative Endonuclease/Exonuclease/phosphatase family protein [Cronobacter muytjensii 530]